MRNRTPLQTKYSRTELIKVLGKIFEHPQWYNIPVEQLIEFAKKHTRSKIDLGVLEAEFINCLAEIGLDPIRVKDDA